MNLYQLIICFLNKPLNVNSELSHMISSLVCLLKLLLPNLAFAAKHCTSLVSAGSLPPSHA